VPRRRYSIALPASGATSSHALTVRRVGSFGSCGANPPTGGGVGSNPSPPTTAAASGFALPDESTNRVRSVHNPGFGNSIAVETIITCAPVSCLTTRGCGALPCAMLAP
jgi:hypothetical protein